MICGADVSVTIKKNVEYLREKGPMLNVVNTFSAQQPAETTALPKKHLRPLSHMAWNSLQITSLSKGLPALDAVNQTASFPSKTRTPENLAQTFRPADTFSS